MKKKLTIAVDGHASCGKSTLAKQLAQKLGYTYLDSGAMYRAVTLYFLEHNISGEDTNLVKETLPKIKISFQKNVKTLGVTTFLNGKNVEKIIRSKKVAQQVSQVAAIKEVRTFLVAQQQVLGEEGGVVMDGRDIGTVVFPNAELKLFMTASLSVRAKRRFMELQEKGIEMTLEEIAENLKQRDFLDSTRKESPLKKAKDAVVIDNSTMTRAEQLAQVLTMVKEKYLV